MRLNSEHFDRQRRAAQRHRERAVGCRPVVISKAKNAHEWRLWREYYRREGLSFSVQQMDERDEKTVPALTPDEFDPPVVYADRRVKD